MSKSLKIEVLVEDIISSGVTDSLFVSKQQYDNDYQLVPKLDSNGKINISLIPDELTSLLDTLNDQLISITRSVSEAISTANQYTDNKLSKKADLNATTGKIRQSQLPLIEDYSGFQDYIQLNVYQKYDTEVQLINDKLNLIGDLSKKADLGTDGKVLASQLPDITTYPGYSSAIQNLQDYIQLNIEDLKTAQDQINSDINGLLTAIQSIFDSSTAGDVLLPNGQLVPNLSKRIGGMDSDIANLKNKTNFKNGGQLEPAGTWGVISKIQDGNTAEIPELNIQAKVLLQMLNDVRKNGGVISFDENFANLIDGFDIGDRVKLNNGEVVISTITDNKTDPNSDMTGWITESNASRIKFNNGKSLQEVKERIVYIEDFNASKTDFDPSSSELEAKGVSNPASKPYSGARQFSFPMQTLKVWNYCDGYLDRGAVASIRNVDSFSSGEPRTEVLGIGDSQQLASYTDRDVVGLYVQTEGQPPLLISTNTSFTENTITCLDLTPQLQALIRKDQIIDVLNGNTKYSSRILSMNGNVITVDSGWYIHGSQVKGTPPNGSQAKFVPNTKIWATNFNVMLKPESDAESMVGIELGAFNNKYPNGAGYGYDIWSGGQYRIGAAFQARGQYTTGLYLYDRCDTGTIVSNPNVGHLIIGSGAPNTYGVLSHKQATSFLSRGAVSYGYAQVTESGGFLTGINSDGAWANFKYSYRVTTSGQTIGDNPVAITNPTAPGQDIFLPVAASSTFRTIYVKNISPTYDVYLGGAVEGGTGSVVIKPKECVQLFCDGNTWFIISHYKPTA